MTLMISDELLEKMADEFVALKLNRHGITLKQFIRAPQICIDIVADNNRPHAETGRADERMKHRRYPRCLGKSDFRRRANV